ncbi:Uma2 family endonuclease [Streptomyces syringium]|uniref:Uma2 family endonuclease n=1 Tax=Streptomyces syringium TaxID=76729 RepID=A0ABS4Y4F4_9ACTN|nr:Uma2 family endonuclease [Streptomyces syringium]MBP2403649.1 Uma2 family endonuclease [Streptomyces syringium]
MGAVGTTRRRDEVATTDNWMFPPSEGWTFDQVKDLELPFGWELVDGGITVRGRTKLWHDCVRGKLLRELEQAMPDNCAVNVERCVMLDENNVRKPDVVVFDATDLDIFAVECTSVDRVRLAVEVVSTGSKSEDRIRKPALFAEAKVPHYWRIELESDRRLAVHEFWLPVDSRSYIPAPMHPVHREKLVTELPFPVEIDLTALLRI